MTYQNVSCSVLWGALCIVLTDILLASLTCTHFELSACCLCQPTSWWKHNCYNLVMKQNLFVSLWRHRCSDYLSTSQWKLCCYYLTMKHDFSFSVRATSQWKPCWYYLMMNHDFFSPSVRSRRAAYLMMKMLLLLPSDETWLFIQHEVVDSLSMSRWKVFCYYLVMKHYFFHSAWGRRCSKYVMMKSLLLLPCDVTWLFLCAVSVPTVGYCRCRNKRPIRWEPKAQRFSL